MDHEVLLAIILKKLEERLKALPESQRGPRGQRGRPGIDGKDGEGFNFSEHEETFKAWAKEFALEFDDFTAEQVEKLRGPRGRDGRNGKDFDFDEHKDSIKEMVDSAAVSFDDFTPEQIEKIRGPRGKDGADGKDGESFNFAEHAEEFKNWAKEFALQFDDFTSEQIEKLRGPRGRDGRDGRDFDFDDHKYSITEILTELASNMRDSLKLKFSDLSDEDIERLRGPRGRDGRDGKDFNFEEHREFFSNLKPKFSDFTPEEISQLSLRFSHLTDEEKSQLKLRFDDLTEDDRRKLKGARGPRGQRGAAGVDGIDGKDGADGKSIRGLPGPQGVRGISGANGVDGVDGRDGVDAPYIIAIDINQYKQDEFEFIFEFSDGTIIRSDPVILPKGGGAIFLGGGGGSGSSAPDTYNYKGFSARFNEAFDTVGAQATLLQILNFSYLAPLITLNTSTSTALREKGIVVASADFTATTTKRSDPITAVTFYKAGVLDFTVAVPNPNGGVETYSDPIGFTDTISYFARVDDGTTVVQSNTITFSFVYPYYYGVGSPGLTPAQVALLTKDVIGNTATVARAFSPTNQVYYFAYPAAYPVLTSILDNSGFETIADWTVTIANITGLDATPVSYRIYEFNNLTTQTGFINTFKQ